MQKRIIFISLSILLITFASFLVLFLIRQSRDVYEEDGISFVSKVDGRDFLIYRNSKFEQKFLTGVNIGAAKPGYFPGELAITKQEYLRWFDYIYEMNSDVIRVYTTMMPAFYDALYEFNQNKDKPLYVMQGLWMNEDTSGALGDAYANDEQIVNEMINGGIDLVDIFHGNATLDQKSGVAYGAYSNDVSKYIIGWILGVEWSPDFVVSTNSNNPTKTSYAGDYLMTIPQASPFEVFLAEFGDAIVSYEMETYQMMRPVSYTNWLTTDPLSHPNEPFFNDDLVSVDTENIKATEAFIPGMFASYHIYPYYPEFMNYSDNYREFIDENDQINTYKAYLRDLFQYHTMPILVAEFGIPASRGKAHEAKYSGYNQGNVTEQMQGEFLSALLEDIYDENYMGGLVFAWQDEWFKRTWNTLDFDLSHRRPFWSNVQTNEQMFGLMGFEPGSVERIFYPDGNFEEWNEITPVYSDDQIDLSIQSDVRYLYLYINATDFDFDSEKLYIPIHTIANQGNDHLMNSNISFSEDADFLIEIDGQENSRITVDAYYDTFYYFNSELYNYLPVNVDYHNKNSGIFNSMLLALSRQIYLPVDQVTMPFDSYETGRLHYGNGNPQSDSYDSLSDFYINDHQIEIQIPWALLNISDPSSKMQLGDFYAFDGFESIPIKNLDIGAAIVSSPSDVTLIQMNAYTWDTWNIPIYHERLKQSYYILQDEFKKYE